MASCCLPWRDVVWYCVLSHVCYLCIALLRWCGLCRMTNGCSLPSFAFKHLPVLIFLCQKTGSQPGLLRLIQIVEIESSRSARVLVLDKFSRALRYLANRAVCFKTILCSHSRQVLRIKCLDHGWDTAQFRCIPICYDARLIVETQCEDYRAKLS